jgi:hypothetical protein
LQRGRHLIQFNDEVISLSAWVIYEGSCEANQLGARVLGELGFEAKAHNGSILLTSSTPGECLTADEADYILSVVSEAKTKPSFADQLWVDTRGHSSGGSEEFDPDEDGDSSFSSANPSFDQEEEEEEEEEDPEVVTAAQFLLIAPLEKKSKYKE